MSTYVLMKILESAPKRYDLGIRLLTFGKVDRVYEHLTSHVQSGQRVLDIGCGTGALTVRAAERGAFVKGIDINPEMLEIARQRAEEAGLGERVEFAEIGVAELDGEPSEAYDIVMSGLCFSELSDGEIDYTLDQVKRILKPGGLLLVADESRPDGFFKRWMHRAIRWPLVIFTYLLTQTTTRAIAHLAQRIQEAGFQVESVTHDWLGTFIQVVAKKRKG